MSSLSAESCTEKLRSIKSKYFNNKLWIQTVAACDYLLSNGLADLNKNAPSISHNDKIVNAIRDVYLMKGTAQFELSKQLASSDLPNATLVVTDSLTCFDKAIQLNFNCAPAFKNKAEALCFIIGSHVNPFDPAAFRQIHIVEDSFFLDERTRSACSNWFMFLYETYQNFLNLKLNPTLQAQAKLCSAACIYQSGNVSDSCSLLLELWLSCCSTEDNLKFSLQVATCFTKVLLELINCTLIPQSKITKDKINSQLKNHTPAVKLSLPQSNYTVEKTKQIDLETALSYYESTIFFLSKNAYEDSKRVFYKSKLLNFLTNVSSKYTTHQTDILLDNKSLFESVCFFLEEVLFQNTEYWLWEWYISYKLVFSSDKNYLNYYEYYKDTLTQFGRGFGRWAENFANNSVDILTLKKRFVHRFPYSQLSKLILLELTFSDWIRDENRTDGVVEFLNSNLPTDYFPIKFLESISNVEQVNLIELACGVLKHYLLALIYKHKKSFKKTIENSKLGSQIFKKSKIDNGKMLPIYALRFNMILAQVYEIESNLEFLKYCKNLLSLIPCHYESMVSLAENFYRSYNLVECKKMYEKLASLYPSQLWPLARIAWIDSLPYIYSRMNWPHDFPAHETKMNVNYNVSFFPKYFQSEKIVSSLKQLNLGGFANELTCAIRAKTKLKIISDADKQQPWYAYWLGSIFWAMSEPIPALNYLEEAALLKLPHAMASLSKIYLYRFCEHQHSDYWISIHRNLLLAFENYKNFFENSNYLLELGDSGVPHEAVFLTSNLLVNSFLQRHPPQFELSTNFFAIDNKLDCVIEELLLFANENQNHVLVLISTLHLHLKRYDLAISSLNRYIQSEPNDIKVSYILVDCYLKMSQFQAAKNVIDRLKIIDPKNPLAYYLGSKVYYNTVQLDKAEKDILQALKLVKNFNSKCDSLSPENVFDYFYIKILFLRYNMHLHEKSVSMALASLRKALDFVQKSMDFVNTISQWKLYGDVFSQVYMLRNVFYDERMQDPVDYYLGQGARAYSNALSMNSQAPYLHLSLATNLIYNSRWLYERSLSCSEDTLQTLKNSVMLLIDNAMASLRTALVLSYKSFYVGCKSERIKIWRSLAQTSALYLEITKNYSKADYQFPVTLRHTPTHVDVSNYFYWSLVAGDTSFQSSEAETSQTSQVSRSEEIGKNWFSASLFWWSQGVEHKYVSQMFKRGFELGSSPSSFTWVLHSILINSDDPGTGRTFAFNVRALIRSIENELDSRLLSSYYESLLVVSSIWMLGIVDRMNFANKLDLAVISNQELNKNFIQILFVLLDQAMSYNPKSALLAHLSVLIKAHMGIYEPEKYRQILSLKFPSPRNTQIVADPFEYLNSATQFDLRDSARIQWAWQLFCTKMSSPESGYLAELENYLDTLETDPINNTPIIQYIRMTLIIIANCKIENQVCNVKFSIANIFNILDTLDYENSSISQYLQHLYSLTPDLARSLINIELHLLIQGLLENKNLECFSSVSNDTVDTIVSLMLEDDLEVNSPPSRIRCLLIDLLYWYTVKWLRRVLTASYRGAKDIDVAWVLDRWCPIVNLYAKNQVQNENDAIRHLLPNEGVAAAPDFHLAILKLLCFRITNLPCEDFFQSVQNAFCKQQKTIHSFDPRLFALVSDLVDIEIDAMDRYGYRSPIESFVLDFVKSCSSDIFKIPQKLLLWTLLPSGMRMGDLEACKILPVDLEEQPSNTYHHNAIDYLARHSVDPWRLAQLQAFVSPYSATSWHNLASCTISLIHGMMEIPIDERWISRLSEHQLDDAELVVARQKLIKDAQFILKSLVNDSLNTRLLLSEYSLLQFLENENDTMQMPQPPDEFLDLPDVRLGPSKSTVAIHKCKIKLLANIKHWSASDLLDSLKSIIMSVHSEVFTAQANADCEQLFNTNLILKASFLQLLALFMLAFQIKGDSHTPKTIVNSLTKKNSTVFVGLWNDDSNNIYYNGAKLFLLLSASFLKITWKFISQYGSVIKSDKNNNQSAQEFWSFLEFLRIRSVPGKCFKSPFLRSLLEEQIKKS